MNQKTAAIASGVVAVALLTGCTGTSTYQYEVKGAVQGQQVDYDCPGEDLAMEIAGFDAGKGGGKARSSSRKSKPKARERTSSDGNGGSTGRKSRNGGSEQVKKTPKIKNKGISLNKKPESPEKIKKIKKSFKFKPKGCKDEYEIYVRASNGNLYEQDVRRVDYDKCLKARIPSGQKAKLFPLCTKG